MAKYLLIESRDPFGSNEVARGYELAAQLATEGNEVTLFLVQNGVLPARRSSRSEELGQLAARGVHILVDELSLRERGIALDRLAPGVAASAIDVVVDLLEAGRKSVWH